MHGLRVLLEDIVSAIFLSYLEPYLNYIVKFLIGQKNKDQEQEESGGIDRRF